MQPSITKLKGIALIVVFLAALLLPLGAMWLGFDPAPAMRERRPAAPFPRRELTWSGLSAFPARFTAYFNDHFGLRNTLVRMHASLKARWLGISPTEHVVIGRDGWLYLQLTLGERVWRSPPGDGKERFPWRAEILARRDWLAARGIGYLLVIACDKSTIYPEHLPWGYTPLRPDSRLDGMIASLAAEPGMDVLDLRPVLLAAKARGQVYHRTDLHWNDFGAYAAFQEIAKRLAAWFPALRAHPVGQPVPAAPREWSGGLANAMGLETVYREYTVRLEPPRAARARPGEAPPTEAPETPMMRTVVMEQPGSGLPRAFMVRDSYGSALVPHLSGLFSHILYSWRQQLDYPLIEKERPDLFIQLITAFDLARPLPWE